MLLPINDFCWSTVRGEEVDEVAEVLEGVGVEEGVVILRFAYL